MSDEGNNDGLGGSAEALARRNLRTIGDGRVLRIMSSRSRQSQDQGKRMMMIVLWRGRGKKEIGGGLLYIYMYVGTHLLELMLKSGRAQLFSLCNNQVMVSERSYDYVILRGVLSSTQ